MEDDQLDTVDNKTVNEVRCLLRTALPEANEENALLRNTKYGASRPLLLRPQFAEPPFNSLHSRKKNAPFLYDVIITHALDWPTLTIQWFPDAETPSGKNYSVHRLLMGTHTSGAQQDYLQIAQVQIPNQKTRDADGDDEGDEDEGGEDAEMGREAYDDERGGMFFFLILFRNRLES